MAWRALERIERLLDEELKRIRAFKLHMPSLLSSDLWKRTGRWETIGAELFRLQDRKGTEFCLAPTFEEEITHLVKQDVRSYKHLPLRLYQISWKFRDEARPRSGLMRCKEFLMKDLYTFDRTLDEARTTYEEVCHLYSQLFQKLSLTCVRAEADTGHIGGHISSEFHVVTDVGEDTLHYCSCGYAINLEKKSCKEEVICCPRCQSSSLHVVRGIELGHAFLLGDLYSRQLQATFQDAQGHMISYAMGCYGIGITRLLATIVELHADEHGIRWPMTIAPYALCILCPPNAPDLLAVAQTVYDRLNNIVPFHGRILLDDREDSLGYKLKDARFMGYPYTLVIGNHYLESDTFELIDRWTNTREWIKDPLEQRLNLAL
jgi:prolyl-tRNA synthetase